MDNSCRIPIVVVAFNRPKSLKRLLGSLQRANYPFEVELIISIDKSDEKSIERIAKRFIWSHGKKQVICHPQKLGLRKHILFAGALSQKYDAVIVLEDDLFVSPVFYHYVVDAYHFYKNDEKIGGISLFAHSYNETAQLPFIPLIDDADVFFMQTPSSWGQCWTRSQWQSFKTWYENNNEKDINIESGVPFNVADWPDSSWKKYYVKYLIKTNKYFVYPRNSLTTNFGDPGVHFHKKLSFQHVPLMTRFRPFFFKEISSSYVKYDANCEMMPESLNHFLPKLKKFDYCVDLYGVKTCHQTQTEYILTSKPCTEFLFSFDRDLKPVEYNVIEQTPGTVLKFAKSKHCEHKIQPVHLQGKELFYYYNLREYQLYHYQPSAPQPTLSVKALIKLLFYRLSTNIVSVFLKH